MTREELDILLLPESRQAIEENIERDPLKVALDGRIPHPRQVATQIKYLQRAKRKLPNLYAARCIIPQRAFEQSSSQECAAAKHLKGDTLLDLTCGLGMDSVALAGHFRRVVALERDAILADITRENLRRLGVENVEVITTSAEDYLHSCEEHFDWIFIDPDRRTSDSKRAVRLEDCSPNVVELMPTIRLKGDKVAIKNSPLFDVDEAARLFPDCSVEVVSLGGECKEVMIYIDHEEPKISAHAIGKGLFSARRSEVDNTPTTKPFEPSLYNYLIIPDVALLKSRVVVHALRSVADVWNNNSFGFATQKVEGLPVRVEEIEHIEPFDAKSLKRQMKGVGVDILLRDFPTPIEQVRKRCALKSGDERKIALTRIGGKGYTIYLK